MSSIEKVTKNVEALKSEGNKHFQKSHFSAAILSYSQALSTWIPGVDSNLKATLLSNRAACHLQLHNYPPCTQDCTDALQVLQNHKSLRCKSLYRRAKAQFLQTETDAEEQDSSMTLLNDAAKDLLQLLSIDPSNTPAQTLLRTVRAKHGLQKQRRGATPVSQTLDAFSKATSRIDREHHCKVLMGLLTNDSDGAAENDAAMELGRRGGIPMLLHQQSNGFGIQKPLQTLACAAAASPRFVQTFGGRIDQQRLYQIMVEKSSSNDDDNDAVRLACLSIWLRLVLYLDPFESLDETSLVDDDLLLRSCGAALGSDPLVAAALDVLSSWTSLDRVNLINADQPLIVKKTPQELRNLKPRDLAAYNKRAYQRTCRDQKWAKERAAMFCRKGLKTLLRAATDTNNHTLRKQVGVVLGRILASIQEEDDMKAAVKSIIETSASIEEIVEEKTEEEWKEEDLIDKMKRAQLTTSLLLGNGEVGAWALAKTKSDLLDLVQSENLKAMTIASELVSAAASVEKARPSLTSLVNRGSLESLVEHPEQDIRSGAASAIAKLGLADKALSANEGEVMGLLEIAVELLNDAASDNDTVALLPTSVGASSPAGTSIERGVEVLGYLSGKTHIKEELAHGFRCPPSAPLTAVEKLVELANQPKAGDSISAYGLATIFGLIAVSNETLRKEAFKDKDISMEQYDELQRLGKTEEEKEAMPQEADDTQAGVEERIRKLVQSNVPRALVKLMEGASEKTLEQCVTALNRMAIEISSRGMMIQQGVLSSCMKLDPGTNPTEVQKNTVRQARQCVSKLLVSTNPALLTTSQMMGSVKPLIQLIRDNDASDLQHFEALLAITNIGSVSEETKTRIIAERGISTLSYAMFSDHELVRRAGTEAMCNLVPHPAMMKHLADAENLRLWLAFAADFEANFECARAAAGCLAMSCYDPAISSALVGLKTFQESVSAMLESGNLEIMHRTLVLVQELLSQDGKIKQAVVGAGFIAFCRAYADSYHDGSKAEDLGFSKEQQGQLMVTIDLAMQIASM